MPQSIPAVAFLGFCERAACVCDGNTNLFKWNVIGLKNNIPFPIFPLTLTGWNIGLALYYPYINKEIVMIITDEQCNELGKINVFANVNDQQDTIPTSTIPSPRLVDGTASRYTMSLTVPKSGWATIFIPLGKSNIVIKQPGTYFLKLLTDSEPIVISQLQFFLINPQPLTPERIAAIRSDPSAVRAIRMELACSACQSKFKTYAGLEPNKELEAEGFSWYETIPDAFKCECGKNTFDLRILRRNLFAFLGQPIIQTEQLSYVPLYEYNALESLRVSFANLISSDSKEEVLQKYIESNPVLLHQIPAERIFFKPQILTFFNADFAIVTPQKELILIEIEKTTTRLLTKLGGVASPLQHAFDQVQSWLHTVDEHRLAVLESLGIDRQAVSSARGVVIAGRDRGYDAQHLRRLKGVDFGRVRFFTYDDILFGFVSLLKNIAKL